MNVKYAYKIFYVTIIEGLHSFLNVICMRLKTSLLSVVVSCQKDVWRLLKKFKSVEVSDFCVHIINVFTLR